MPPRLSRLDHLCHVLASLHAQLSSEDDGVEYLYWQVLILLFAFSQDFISSP